jgi:hypothetical protein
MSKRQPPRSLAAISDRLYLEVTKLSGQVPQPGSVGWHGADVSALVQAAATYGPRAGHLVAQAVEGLALLARIQQRELSRDAVARASIDEYRTAMRLASEALVELSEMPAPSS